MTLPRKLHFIWVSRDGIEMPEEYAPNIEEWKRRNRNWETKFWKDEEVESLVREDFPHLASSYASIRKAVMRSDLARFLVLLKYGGIYLDVDLKPVGGQKDPLDQWLASGTVFNKYAKRPPLPQVPSEDYENLDGAQSIMCRENCQMDASGYGLANGFMAMQPGTKWAEEFVEAQKGAHHGYVLDYMGPWALTRFMRARTAKARDAGPEALREHQKEMTVLPAHYFLWERWRMKGCDIPPYVLSEHTGQNTWGDKTKKIWYKS